MKFLWACLAFFSIAGLANADIAPTTFTGTNVFPAQSADVRMESADVHIIWGSPCSLTAEFTMINESGKDLEVETGFPVGAYPLGHFDDDDAQGKSPTTLEAADPAVIAITINGAATTAYRRLPAERIGELRWRYATWYFAKIVFQPGKNTVSVRTRLTPSGLSGEPYKASLSYCISTGGRWKDAIGRETVEITFPGINLHSLSSQIVPQSGQFTGSTVHWEFHNIEPRSEEYDINLEFLLPAVAAKLSELKTAYEHQPQSSPAGLRYAVHLFCLGAMKGNSGFPPSELSSEEYESILAHTIGPSRKAVFSSFYVPYNGRYAAQASEWTSDRLAMIQILADAGYSQHYAEHARVAEARAIVEQCLARDPRNADAWSIYLTHFWRFSFAARGHWFGRTVFSAPLVKAIETAYQNCPNDKRIIAWHQAMKNDGEAPGVPNDYSGVPECFRNEFTPEDSAAAPVQGSIATR